MISPDPSRPPRDGLPVGRPLPAPPAGDASLPRRYDAAVRWRDDVGWELRCDRCAEKKLACFWPLTTEFWERKRMGMCRACERERMRTRKRNRYHTDPAFRAHLIATVAQFARDNPGKRTAYNRAKWLAIKSDPLLLAQERVRARRAQQAYRERRRAMQSAA